MAKRIKRERGFYRELKKDLQDMNIKKFRDIKTVEYWLKHLNDPTKDIRFYVSWKSADELGTAINYIGGSDKEDYEDNVLMRFLEVPKTRREKMIYKSQLHGLPHLNEIR